MYVLNRRMFQRGKDNKYFWFHEQSNTFFSVKTYLCGMKLRKECNLLEMSGG